MEGTEIGKASEEYLDAYKSYYYNNFLKEYIVPSGVGIQKYEITSFMLYLTYIACDLRLKIDQKNAQCIYSVYSLIYSLLENPNDNYIDYVYSLKVLDLDLDTTIYSVAITYYSCHLTTYYKFGGKPPLVGGQTIEPKLYDEICGEFLNFAGQTEQKNLINQSKVASLTPSFFYNVNNYKFKAVNNIENFDKTFVKINCIVVFMKTFLMFYKMSDDDKKKYVYPDDDFSEKNRPFIPEGFKKYTDKINIISLISFLNMCTRGITQDIHPLEYVVHNVKENFLLDYSKKMFPIIQTYYSKCVENYTLSSDGTRIILTYFDQARKTYSYMIEFLNEYIKILNNSYFHIMDIYDDLSQNLNKTYLFPTIVDFFGIFVDVPLDYTQVASLAEEIQESSISLPPIQLSNVPTTIGQISMEKHGFTEQTQKQSITSFIESERRQSFEEEEEQQQREIEIEEEEEEEQQQREKTHNVEGLSKKIYEPLHLIFTNMFTTDKVSGIKVRRGREDISDEKLEAVIKASVANLYASFKKMRNLPDTTKPLSKGNKTDQKPLILEYIEKVLGFDIDSDLYKEIDANFIIK